MPAQSLLELALDRWLKLIRTNLNYINSDVIEHGVYLLNDKICGNMVDASDTSCVLGSQCCCCRHCIAEMVGDDFLVGL